jgi:hypothetical protein
MLLLAIEAIYRASEGNPIKKGREKDNTATEEI